MANIAEDITIRPHLLRAVYAWCEERKHTPYLAVRGGRSDVKLPPMLNNGKKEMFLNISSEAVRDLVIKDYVSFTARFDGSAFYVVLPIPAIIGIFARENGIGLSFRAQEEKKPAAAPEVAKYTPPKLKVI